MEFVLILDAVKRLKEKK